MKAVVDRAAALTRGTGAVLELAEGDEMVYRAASRAAAGNAGLRIKKDGSLSGLCVTLGEPLYSEDTAADPRVDHAACGRVGVASMICVPLFHLNQTVGVLKVLSDRPKAFTPEDILVLQMLAEIIAASLSHASELESVGYAITHDNLTTLQNRQAFDSRLSEELARRDRYGRPLSLAFFDLDHFKDVNDRFGHIRGDAVLREFAETVTKVRRKPDAWFRLGGDEFALLLPETNGEQAARAVHRYLLILKSMNLGEGLIGYSVGVVEATGTESPVDLVGRADALMYEQKRAKKVLAAPLP